MKIFRSISVRGEKEFIKAAIEDVRKSLVDGWASSTADEVRINSRRPVGEFYCFSCPRNNDRPAATIFLVHRNDNSILTANVLPKRSAIYHLINTTEFCKISLRNSCDRRQRETVSTRR